MGDATRLDLPGLTVRCLRDGAYVFDDDVFPDVVAMDRAARLKAVGLAQIDTAFSAYLLQPDEGPLTLVDAGCGALYGPTAGHLVARLAELGVTPGDIELLVFTHLHGDHWGGAVTEGRPTFANAQVMLHTAEHAYWQTQTGPVSEIFDLYGERMQTVTDGDPIAPGITAWHLPGHTPGHMGLRLGQKAVLVGDILHSYALQLPDPQVNSVYDMDPDQARASRQEALAEIAAQDLIWSGSHGIGETPFHRLRATGDGYEAQPA